MPEVHSLLEEDPEAIAGYRLVGRLGEGGQGIVWLGRDRAGRSVAVKMLHARLAGDAEAQTRFRREIAAAQRVARFCTAQVLDADVDGDQPFIVTEFVNGPSLQQLVAADGPRPEGALARLGVGMASALSAIHAAGIVHRDFKPGNVLLGPDGPRVIDFGIARALDTTATLTRGAIGTPAYMAPEQLSRGTVGPPADVFAWAATMVFAATGRPPFGADSVPAVIGRVLRAEPDLSGVPRSLRPLIAACLAKDAAARPTVRQVLDRLLGGAAGEAAGMGREGVPPVGRETQPKTVPLGPWYVVPPQKRTRKRLLWLVPPVVVLVAAVAGAAVWVLGGEPKHFTALTDACGMVPASTVERLVPQHPQHETSDDADVRDAGKFLETGCDWRTPPGSASSAHLSFSVQVERDLPKDWPVHEQLKGIDRAKEDQRDARRKAQGNAGRTDDGQYVVTSYGPYVELDGFGDEGFTISRTERDKEGTAYPRFADVRVRWGNAVIETEYTLGYGPEGRRMTPGAESGVRKGAQDAARAILDRLAHCGPCTR
ncbi:serine/threonine-protein kinase [Actinomadura verrucosospora]|uniref:Serine/threonine protein kinase n=1 Tax=Actinomadura verrucosospora TaxID=46165 RepID=A0A7D4A634_ACTVE|nr:serine/threonine-protein kinase [Actinomadura verrucosospora]QKG23445.1 serine/threonine protein kinase [Actinomadura verrucosospora]